MKASMFAILIGVYLALLGPVLLIAPATITETLRTAMQDPFQVSSVLILFAMFSALALANKPAGNGLPEKLVRLLAWLTLIKVVVLFWVPAARELSITYLHNFPLSLLRIEGLAVTAIGFWLIYWGTRTMRHANENTTN